MKYLKFLALACCAVFLWSCSRSPSSTADIPRQLPQRYRVTVAPFTQPRTPAQLIAGAIPDNQGMIPDDDLAALNILLRDALRETSKRPFVFLEEGTLPANWRSALSTGQPSGLSRWLTFGREIGAQYLLVPQVLDWHERAGSQGGVTESAHARVELFLINVEGGSVAGRSIFEEKQVGLIDNLLSVGDFIKRKGQWVTASQLAEEGMRKAARELGL